MGELGEFNRYEKPPETNALHRIQPECRLPLATLSTVAASPFCDEAESPIRCLAQISSELDDWGIPTSPIPCDSEPANVHPPFQITTGLPKANKFYSPVCQYAALLNCFAMKTQVAVATPVGVAAYFRATAVDDRRVVVHARTPSDGQEKFCPLIVRSQGERQH